MLVIYITHASYRNQNLICVAYGRRRREDLNTIGLANKKALLMLLKVTSVVEWTLVGLGSW